LPAACPTPETEPELAAVLAMWPKLTPKQKR
jgi:hypothetical protein